MTPSPTSTPRPREGARRLAVLRQFRVIVAALREHYAAVEDRAGIGGAQLWALKEVAASGDASIGELARRMGIQASTASNLVRSLLERSLVVKLRGKGDARVVCVRATPEGRRLLRRAPQPVEGVLQSALGRLPEPRLGRLHEDLAILIDLLQGERQRGGEVLLPQLVKSPRARRKPEA